MKQRLLLVAAALLLSLPFVRAQSGTAGPLEWSYSEADSVLTISGTGAMPDYIGYGSTPWHAYNFKIKTVVIEPGVESIGAYALYSIFNLSSVTIPATVTTIGANALSNNTRLLNLTIPPSVTSIGDSAFYHCQNLETINIPAATTIGQGVFAYCSGLKSITADEDNPRYASFGGALYNKELTRLIAYPGGKEVVASDFAPSVTTIAAGAFHGCYRLTEISFPASVTSIESHAIEGCGQLHTLRLPASDLVLGEGFVGEHNTFLTAITVAEGSPSYVVADSVLFNKDRSLLLLYPPQKGANSYTVPSTVERIADYAFAGAAYVTADSEVSMPPRNIYVGESVTSIGKRAFAYRQYLDTLSIAASVARLDYEALYAISVKYLALYWTNPAEVLYVYGTLHQSYIRELHVPVGTEALYRATPPWNQVETIVADIPNSAERPSPSSFKAVARGGQIVLSGLAGREIIRIYNIVGRPVYARSADGPAMIIPVSSLPSGVYILQAGNEAVKLMLRN
ncbi:MAG: leucine-rich repeat domain-containing protein [Tannerellaceae bacterium]|jgi:hypothetical protein|nr:leucine-rich repeat domain-containing protein [Tannerellaceae bacterium]